MAWQREAKYAIDTNTRFSLDVATACSVPSVRLASPALWSPRSPIQYTAAVQLLAAATGAVLDEDSIVFGLRRLDVVNRSHWKLNGAYLFLHGYVKQRYFLDSSRCPSR